MFSYQELERDQEKILKDDSSLTHCHGISTQCTFHLAGRINSVPLVMVANSRSVGGFRNIIGKHVVFDDGEFEVTLIKSPKNALELQEIVAALLIEQIDTKHMYTFKTNHITFESLEEIPWTLDGEFGGQHDFVQIHNEKQALQIMVSPEHISSLMEYPEKLSLEAAEEKTEE